MAKYVHGTYTTPAQANDAVEALISKGYEHNNIILVSNDETNEQLSSIKVEKKIYGVDSDDESFVDKVKDVFTGDSTDKSSSITKNEKSALDHYTDEIRNGRIIILVDEKPDVDGSSDSASYPTTVDPSANSVADPVSTNPEVVVGSINQPAVDPAINTEDQTDTDSVDPTTESDHRTVDSTKEKSNHNNTN